MKITDIKIQLIDVGHGHNPDSNQSHSTEAGILRVFTNEGIEGNADYSTLGFSPHSSFLSP